MKKLFALLLSLCLLCSAAALADNSLSWESVSEAATAMGGEFKTFDEIAVKLWMPATMQEIELTDDDRANGYIGYYASEDETGEISVVYVDAQYTSLEDYQAYLLENGVQEVETGSVNGLACISYESDDTGVLAFTTQKGYILEIAAAPLSEDSFKSIIGVVMSSIQSAE